MLNEPCLSDETTPASPYGHPSPDDLQLELDPSKKDPVFWPAHYNQGDIECIDAMAAAFGIDAVRIYAKLAAFKYLWRSDEKGTSDQDLKKAVWYTRFARGDDPRKERAA